MDRRPPREVERWQALGGLRRRARGGRGRRRRGWQGLRRDRSLRQHRGPGGLRWRRRALGRGRRRWGRCLDLATRRRWRALRRRVDRRRGGRRFGRAGRWRRGIGHTRRLGQRRRLGHARRLRRGRRGGPGRRDRARRHLGRRWRGWCRRRRGEDGDRRFVGRLGAARRLVGPALEHHGKGGWRQFLRWFAARVEVEQDHHHQGDVQQRRNEPGPAQRAPATTARRQRAGRLGHRHGGRRGRQPAVSRGQTHREVGQPQAYGRQSRRIENPDVLPHGSALLHQGSAPG